MLWLEYEVEVWLEDLDHLVPGRWGVGWEAMQEKDLGHLAPSRWGVGWEVGMLQVLAGQTLCLKLGSR